MAEDSEEEDSEAGISGGNIIIPSVVASTFSVMLQFCSMIVPVITISHLIQNFMPWHSCL